MATKAKPVKTEPEVEPPVHRKVAVELERGSVSVSRDGLTFSTVARTSSCSARAR
jgi:hypothetical protein